MSGEGGASGVVTPDGPADADAFTGELRVSMTGPRGIARCGWTHRAEFSSSMTLKDRAPLVATTAPRPEGVRAGAPPLAVLTPRRASTQDRHTRGSHRCRYATGGTQRKGTGGAARRLSRLATVVHTHTHVQSVRPHRPLMEEGIAQHRAAPTCTLGPLTAPHRTSSYEGPIIPQRCNAAWRSRPIVPSLRCCVLSALCSMLCSVHLLHALCLCSAAATFAAARGRG